MGLWQTFSFVVISISFFFLLIFETRNKNWVRNTRLLLPHRFFWASNYQMIFFSFTFFKIYEIYVSIFGLLRVKYVTMFVMNDTFLRQISSCSILRNYILRCLFLLPLSRELLHGTCGYNILTTINWCLAGAVSLFYVDIKDVLGNV